MVALSVILVVLFGFIGLTVYQFKTKGKLNEEIGKRDIEIEKRDNEITHSYFSGEMKQRQKLQQGTDLGSVEVVQTLTLLRQVLYRCTDDSFLTQPAHAPRLN
ncbi:hypothetical protein KIL84_004723 [Mauremys mutica]|uniref:Uncharacterized protein n=1 Tax=Mauremys mutica TaxID=74926 RepID=A0A9D3XPK5_9SAUR|nr:hypothetical protein KIL84_004723 [Mauremys mutica]